MSELKMTNSIKVIDRNINTYNKKIVLYFITITYITNVLLDCSLKSHDYHKKIIKILN